MGLLRIGKALRAPFKRLRGSVRLRLLVGVLLFSSVVTLTLTAAQLYLEYRRGVAVIENRLTDINRSYLGSLGEGLWRLDEEYLQIQLDGIRRLSDVRAVEVRESPEAAEAPLSGEPLVVAAGRRAARSVVAREFPIFYPIRGVERRIGTLYVEATLTGLYRELMDTILVILVTQGLKTFLVSLFIIYIVHRLITRHLAVLADFVHGYDLHRPPPPLRLPREAPAQEDELEHVVAAFNALCASLQRAYGDLHEREARIRRLVESNIIGIFFWDLSGEISGANDAFLHIVGYERPDLLAGRVRWAAMTPPEFRAADERATGELRMRGSCRPYEKEFVRQDGRRVPVLIGGALFEASQDQGVAFVLDLTERRAREAAEAANRAKSELLANMSHELRSPLNTILGFTRLMTHEPALPASTREDLGRVLRSGEHLHALINDVLDLSKLEAGRATLNETDFDLDFLLDELKDMLTPAAVDKGLQLVFAPRPQVPRQVRTDPLKLRQVLINLIGNAIKFTAAGGVTVRVERLSPESDGDRCRLGFAVADTGAGIAQDEIGGLFGAFAQAEAGRRAHEGTGLGLAISRGFVRLMGGDMQIESEVGKGTTVRFSADVRIAAGVAPRPAPRRVVGLAPGQPRYRILAVDDHAEGRQLLVRLLAPLGFELREAGNGLEALELWRQWRPHLIWMDLRMPVLDGREAARRIRASEAAECPPGAAADEPPCPVVVIALTASSFEEERADVLMAGCNDFLRKPFRESDLFALMEKHLGVRFAELEEEPARAPVPAPDAAALGTLPPALRAELEQALNALDPNAIDRAIEHVREVAPALAEGLAPLTQDFEYDRILALLRVES